MRATRALLASIGAGTALVLAGTLAMATISTIVAFSGLPGMAPSVAPQRAAILTPDRTAESRDRRAPAVMVDRVAGPERRTSSRRGRTVVRRDVAVATRTPVRTQAAAPQTTFTAPDRRPGDRRPQPAADPVPARPALVVPVEQVGKDLDDTAGSVGTAVQPVSPRLGQVANGVGDAVGTVARDAATGLDAALGGPEQP